MKNLVSYYVKEREYQTNGYLIMVRPADSVHIKRVEKCEAVADAELIRHAGEEPSVSLSTESLIEILESARAKRISLFVGGPDEPVLFVWGEEAFAILSPMEPKTVKVKVPLPAGQVAEVNPEAGAAMSDHPDPIVNDLHNLIGQINSLQTKLRTERGGCACGDGHCCAKHAYTFQLLDDAHRLIDRATDDLRKQ